jgi:ArsR family transcriptional regulator
MPHSSNMPGLSMRTLERSAQTLRVLGHPARLKLVELLSNEARNVGELAGLMQLEPHVVSQHLGQMRAYGLVTRQRRGKHVYYRVNHASALGVLRCIQRNEQIHAVYEDGEAI